MANRETKTKRLGGYIKVPQHLKGRTRQNRNRDLNLGFQAHSHIAFIILSLSSTTVFQPEDSGGGVGVFLPQRVCDPET